MDGNADSGSPDTLRLKVRWPHARWFTTALLDPNLTCRAALATLSKKIHLPPPRDEEYVLYVPTNDPQEGFYAPETKTLKSCGLQDNDHIEIHEKPYRISIVGVHSGDTALTPSALSSPGN